MPSPIFDLLLFGASGDLSFRKLLPSLYTLWCRGDWAAPSKIIGIGRHDISHDDFRAQVREKFLSYLPKGVFDETKFAQFAQQLVYVQLDATQSADYAKLAPLLNPQAAARVFYCSTPPGLFAQVSRNLAENNLITPESRIVLEKPLGRDLASAQAINREVGSLFKEQQIFRIDHYLGKETVQNLLALRFGNVLFEPLWRREWIRDVQITLAETLGVGNRMEFYDQTGALRDMLQNHLLQLLCITTMEPPASLNDNAVRDEKLKVLRALKPMNADDVRQNTVRGQYTAGFSEGAPVPGYAEEKGGKSNTESYVAVKAQIDNWRWAGVPFYLRSGKRLAEKSAEIVIQFREMPHSIFPGMAAGALPNQLRIRLQPEEDLRLTLFAKQPGNGMKLKAVDLKLDFLQSLDTHDNAPRMEAYERLLMDAIAGRLTLFTRADELEAAWTWVEPIMQTWAADGLPPKPYAAGSWGPAAASALIARDGLQWREESA